MSEQCTTVFSGGGAPNCIVNRMTSDAALLLLLLCIFLAADHLSDLPGQLRGNWNDSGTQTK